MSRDKTLGSSQRLDAFRIAAVERLVRTASPAVNIEVAVDSQSVSFGVTKVHYTISEDRTGGSVEQKRRCLAVLTERSYGLTGQVKLDSDVAESPLSLEDFATAAAAVRGPRVSWLEDHAV